jgi:hypothetical protein
LVSAPFRAFRRLSQITEQVWGWSEQGVEAKHAEDLNLNLGDRRLRLTMDLARELMERRVISPSIRAASSSRTIAWTSWCRSNRLP